MQTDKIRILEGTSDYEAALDEVMRLAEFMKLDDKQTMRLRLLAEETLGMVSAIAGDYDAEFWVEGSKDNECKIHLLATTEMNYDKKQEFIDVSTSKKNSANTGFMGKVREIFENALYSIDEVGMLQAEYGGGSLMYGTMGMYDFESTGADLIYTWSLQRYRDSIDEQKDSDEVAMEAWDELEKSIVASIADDVSVSVRGNSAELIIDKKF